MTTWIITIGTNANAIISIIWIPVNEAIINIECINFTKITNPSIKVPITNAATLHKLLLIPILKNALNQEGAQLLIIANDYNEDVLNFLKANRTKHLTIGSKQMPMDFTAVDIDQITKESRNKLEDLAMLCGCKIYRKLFTPKAEIIADPNQFIGHAKKIITTPKLTQVITNTEELSPEHRKNIDSKIKEFDKELKKL